MTNFSVDLTQMPEPFCEMETYPGSYLDQPAWCGDDAIALVEGKVLCAKHIQEWIAYVEWADQPWPEQGQEDEIMAIIAATTTTTYRVVTRDEFPHGLKCLSCHDDLLPGMTLASVEREGDDIASIYCTACARRAA